MRNFPDAAGRFAKDICHRLRPAVFWHHGPVINKKKREEYKQKLDDIVKSKKEDTPIKEIKKEVPIKEHIETYKYVFPTDE